MKTLIAILLCLALPCMGGVMVINSFRFAGGDPYFSSVSLLLHCNGSNGSAAFTDNSSNGHTFAAIGNAQISTAESKFGGASAIFDGTGDSLDGPSDADFQFGTGDFTVEAWVYFSSTASFFGILNVGDASSGSYSLYLNGTTQKIESVRYGDAGGSGVTTQTFTTGQWYHIAAVRESGTAKIYVNGVADAGATYSMGDCTKTAATIGTLWELGGYDVANGYLDDLRVTKGVARYTANFTPPTAAHPDL